MGNLELRLLELMNHKESICTHFQGLRLPYTFTPPQRAALTRTRHDPSLLVHSEERKSRKEEGVATHDFLGA